MKTLIFTFAVLTLIVNISFSQLNTENLFKAPFISAGNSKQNMQSLMQNSGKDIVFIENLGQIRDSIGKKRPDVLFLTRSQGVDMYITSSGITYVFRKTEGNVKDKYKASDMKTSLYRLDMEFVGINKNLKIKKELVVEQQFNYYTPEYTNGISPRGYKKITIENIYDGIDLVYCEKEGKMKYDFVVRAGADPTYIKMKYKGAGNVYIDKDGSLIITIPMGEIREEKPYTYSKSTGLEIESIYKVNENVVQFEIADYNKSEDIIIDPYRQWATYYGGSGSDYGYSICTDNSDNLYITGYTVSTDFPIQTLTGAYNQTTYGGGDFDVFILKFNSSGTRIWATYYGGSLKDYGNSICTDNSGNLYVTGLTWSTNFSTQTLTGAYNQTTFGGYYDGYILKFNSSGARLWATYYGGSNKDDGIGICTDNSDNLYVTGFTNSTDFPIQTLTGAYNQNHAGSIDAFILKFNSSGARQWATYYGGSVDDLGYGICIDNSGALYVTGWTCSSNFPTQTLTGAYNQSYGGGGFYPFDAFILKFNSSNARIWATYYGGNSNDYGYSICTDNSCNLYVAGYTYSTNFPTQTLTGAYNQSTHGGGDYDAIILKFNSSGARLWATHYGGNGQDVGYSICTDNSCNLYVTGYTYSTNFPTQTLTGAYNQTTYGGGHDAFILNFNSCGARLWATYYGGNNRDWGWDICTDNSGNPYVTGESSSGDFPVQTLTGAYNQTYGGSADAFILKFSVAPSNLTTTNITYQSADLGWTENGTGTSWDIELGQTGFTPTGTPTANDVTSNPYTYVSLTANTTYDWYVRSDCGGSQSNWVGPSTFTTPDPFSGGDGSSGSPWQISDITDLSYLSTHSSYWSDYFIQTADIDAPAGSFSPIGNSTTNFTGSYDGDDHTIDGLYIASSTDYCGLFGYINGGNINNLSVINVNISANNYVGGLVGYYNNSTVTECFSTGSVNGGGFYVGGLVGENYGGSVTECYSTGSVTGLSAVGGFVGLISNGGTVTDCYSIGSVTGSIVGGLVGYTIGGTVSNSFWDYQTSGTYTSAGGECRSTDSMKMQSTFIDAGWSPSIWYMDAGADFNDGYPYLAWQNPGGTPLPVELFSFTASVNKNDVTLNWTTASEINNAGFDVERQPLSNGKDIWTKIGFVEGYGTTNEPKNYTFIDRNLITGKYNYRLVQRDYNNRSFEHFLSNVVIVGVPKKYAISQNYPNPFNPKTKIDYELPYDGKVNIVLYDITGREIATIVNEVHKAGYYTADFNASNLASGIYYYRMIAGDFTAIKKMVLLK